MGTIAVKGGTMPVASGAVEIKADDTLVLRSMIESYERSRAEQQDFIDRSNDADRAFAVARPRSRRVANAR
jgi:hypothetical protein